MEADGSELLFYCVRKEMHGTIKMDLGTIRISVIDTEAKKTLCKWRRHHGIALITKKGRRKLYFLTYAKMQIAITKN